MKRILAVALVVALVGFVGGRAFAADAAAGGGAGEMVKAGSNKIAIMGAANYADVAGDADAYVALFAVAVEYGYMVADQFEMAARATVALAQAGSAGTTARVQAYSIVFIPKFRFPVQGSIAPYIGPKFGGAYATVSGTGAVGGVSVSGNQAVFIWGAVAGIDIFLAKQVALFVEYDFTQFKVGGHHMGGGSLRIRDQGITAGLEYWW